MGPDNRDVASCAPPIEVVHAFGTCPDRVRNNICMLEDARVAYTVGSRVAITGRHSAGSKHDSSGELSFLSTGLRVSRVTAIICSPDKRFVAVCYKAVGEALTAYSSVYHIPTRPRPSRVKTLSYERQKHHQRQQLAGSRYGDDEVPASCDSSSSYGSSRKVPTSALASSTRTAEFVTANFSDDGRILALLDGGPAWTLLWFEWKTGTRLFTLQLGSALHRIAFSPIDQTKTATAGADGLFRIWSTQGGKVAPMTPIPGLREASLKRKYFARPLVHVLTSNGVVVHWRC